MTDDTPRDEVLAARAARHRRAIIAGGLLAALTVGVGFGALWASDVLRLDDGPTPALANRVTTTSRGGDDAPPPCRPGLTPDAPLRLWIGGDSLAGTLGPSLGGQAGETGIVQPIYDSRVSSGLSSPDFFDWPEHATTEIARLTPEIVVFIIGANDWRTPSEGRTGRDETGGSDSSEAPTGEGDSSAEPAWRLEYALRVEEMLRILESNTPDGRVRPVYWVGAPTMQDDRTDAGVKALNDVARLVVERHPEAAYVDAYQLFADADGEYTPSLEGHDGKSVRVRADDGVHITPAGGDLLGERIYDQLDVRCDLDAQAVKGQAKPVLRTKGSTDVDRTSRTGGNPSATATTAAPPAPAPTPAPAFAPAPAPPPSTTGTTTATTTAATTPDTTPDTTPASDVPGEPQP